MGRFSKTGLIVIVVVGALAVLNPFDNGQVFAQTLSPQGKTAPNPSPQPVTVTNTPLPVTGTVGITGTSSVNVTNSSLPVTISNSSIPVTGSVGITGNPSVSVTGTVGITGTPSVNVANSSTLPVSVQNTSIPVTGPKKNVLSLKLTANGIATGSAAGVRVNLPPAAGVAVLDVISAYCKGDVSTTGGEFTISSYMTQIYGVPQGVTFTASVGSAIISDTTVYGAGGRWGLSSVPENTLGGAVFWNLPPSPVNIPVGNVFDIEVTLINSATILCEVAPVWHYEE